MNWLEHGHTKANLHGTATEECNLTHYFFLFPKLKQKPLYFNIIDYFHAHLDVGWVQEDSDRGTEGLSWQVGLEVCSDGTRRTVSSGDLTPDDSNLGTSNLLRSSVDVSNTLTKVELGLLWSGDTLNLNQGDVWVGNRLGSLVRNVFTLHVHYSKWLLVYAVGALNQC